MKVIHISTTDFWGYGTSAYRLHKKLQVMGVDSVMLTLVKSTGDPSVKMVIKDPIDQTKIRVLERVYPDTETISNIAISRWEHILGINPMPKEGELLFSLGDSDVEFNQISLISEADIVHIHWSPGFLNYETIPLSLMDKYVFISVYDANPFSGGCHTLNGCDGYKTGCRDCPRVSAQKKHIISQNYEAKKRCYELLNPYVIFSNSWLGSMALESGIFNNIDTEIKVVPFGVPEDVFFKVNKLNARKKLMLPEKKSIILFCSSFLHKNQNGIQHILDAISMIKDEMDIILLLLGAHPEEVENFKNIPVYAIGFVPHEEILRLYYSASDVIIAPLFKEGISLAVLEAMACGVPVVGYNYGGIKDVVRHKITGYLAKYNKVEDLAEGLRWILKNEDIKNKLGKNAKEKIKKEYTLKHQAELYIKLYENALRKKKEIRKDKFVKWGEDLFLNKKLDRAMEVFEKLLVINSKDPEILNNLGVIFWEKGFYKKAFSYFEKAYKIDPSLEEIKNNYYRALENLNQFKEFKGD